MRSSPGQRFANLLLGWSAERGVQFLHDYGEVALRVAQQLSRNYYSAYDEIRTLGPSNVLSGVVTIRKMGKFSVIETR